MAGRGTDIKLGESEFLAKQEMRKMGMDEQLIMASVSYNETDDQKFSKPAIYSRNFDKYKAQIDKEKEQVIKAGVLRS